MRQLALCVRILSQSDVFIIIVFDVFVDLQIPGTQIRQRLWRSAITSRKSIFLCTQIISPAHIRKRFKVKGL